MSTLTKELYDDTTRYIDMVKQSLPGLTLKVSSDLLEWKRVSPDLSKPFDPDLNDIRPSDAFWIGLYDDGECIACGGGRVFECDDFIREYLTTYLLFGDIAPSVDSKPYTFDEPGPVLSGRVGYAGGVWVHPDYKGLAKVVSQLGKVIALRRLRVDHYTALIRRSRECWAISSLGWRHGCRLTSGHYLGKGDSESGSLDFFWTDHREIVGLIERTLPEVHYRGPSTVDNIAAACL